jgi:hypothetical protein
MGSCRATPRRDHPCAAERLDELEARAALVEHQLELVEALVGNGEPEQGS